AVDCPTMTIGVDVLVLKAPIARHQVEHLLERAVPPLLCKNTATASVCDSDPVFAHQASFIGCDSGAVRRDGPPNERKYRLSSWRDYDSHLTFGKPRCPAPQNAARATSCTMVFACRWVSPWRA